MVLSDAAYLTTGGGDIFWLAREQTPLHARAIQTFFEPRALRSGDRLFIEASDLRVGRRITIELDSASEWEASSISPDERAPLPAVKTSIERLLAALAMAGEHRGLGRVIPLIAAMADAGSFPDWPRDLLLDRAVWPVVGIARSCLERDAARAIGISRELVGLGPGLTPAGDDFLGGLFFSAFFLKRVYPDDIYWDQNAVASLIGWARNRTHPISHAILSDLCAGDGPEPLHDLIVSLLKGEEMGCVAAAAGRLLALGSTSGSDLLAGALTGMLMVVGKEQQ
jgi:hypothetical protein